ncbi:MAG: tetratricopeptide repeat protein, partial [Methanotrichaceae archaeon]|nr:tetratricopeptide repeat protein [Methanotrichaceae archaeon]
ALKALDRQVGADEAYARAEELGCKVQNKRDAETSSIPKMLAITSIKATGDDEFVVIANSRSVVQNIEGWTLDIIDGRTQSIPLPDFTLGPEERINVHLGKGESGKADIFLNSAVTLNDTAGNVTLKDETGMGVASFGYRIEPDGSITGIMTAEAEFSYPPSGSNEVKMVVREAGSGPYVAERTEYEPETAYNWIDKGNALAELGNYEEAVKALDNATKLSPQDKHIWMSKGLILSAHLGRYNESIEAYERAIHIDPGDADAWFGKGATLNKTGRYEEAIKSLDRATELDPKSVAAWKVKGDALKALGHNTAADEAYTKARELGYQG